MTDHKFNAWTKRKSGTVVKTSERHWNLPLKWNHEAAIRFSAWESFVNQGHSEEALAEQGFVRPSRDRVFCEALADPTGNGPVLDHRGMELYVCESCQYMAPCDNAYGFPEQGTDDDGNFLYECCDKPVRPTTVDDLHRKLTTLVESTPWLEWHATKAVD